MALLLRVNFLKALGGNMVLSDEVKTPKPGPSWGECGPPGMAPSEFKWGRKLGGIFWGMRLGELTLVAGISWWAGDGIR